MRIDFVFEALPIEMTPDGYGAAYVDGVACIDYETSDAWRVSEITIELDKTVQYEATPKRVIKKRAPPSRVVRQIIELALLTEPRWQAEIKEKIGNDAMRRAINGMVAMRPVGAM